MDNITSYNHYRALPIESNTTLNTEGGVQTFEVNMNNTNVLKSYFLFEGNFTKDDNTNLAGADLGSMDNNAMKLAYDVLVQISGKTVYERKNMFHSLIESLIFNERDNPQSMFNLNTQADGLGDGTTERRTHLIGVANKFVISQNLDDFIPYFKDFPEIGLNVDIRITLTLREKNFVMVRDAQATNFTITKLELLLFRFTPNERLKKEINSLDTFQLEYNNFKSHTRTYTTGDNDFDTSFRTTTLKPISHIFIANQNGKTTASQTLSNETLNSDNINYAEIRIGDKIIPQYVELRNVNFTDKSYYHYNNFLEAKKELSGIETQNIGLTETRFRTVYPFTTFNIKGVSVTDEQINTLLKFGVVAGGTKTSNIIAVIPTTQIFKRNGKEFELISD